MYKLKNIIGIITIAAFLGSCVQSTKTSDKSKTDTTSKDIELFKSSVNTIRPHIRNIEDVSALLYLSGASFMPNAVGDPVKWEAQKNNELALAANMGVYVVDGIYQAAYDEKQGAYMSFMAGKSIAMEMGVSDLFEEMIIKRLDEGVCPEDSLIDRFSDIISKSEIKFKEKDASRLFTAFVSGSYVEKQYLLFNSVYSLPSELSEEDKLMLTSRLILVASEELKQLPELIKIIDDNRKEGDALYLYDKLVELENMRSELNLSTSFDKIKPADFFNNPKMEEMYQKIKEIRAFVVLGK